MPKVDPICELSDLRVIRFASAHAHSQLVDLSRGPLGDLGDDEPPDDTDDEPRASEEEAGLDAPDRSAVARALEHEGDGEREPGRVSTHSAE